MAGPGVMIAQALGRWGNFFNGEAYGEIVSEGHPLYFMRMSLLSDRTINDELLGYPMGAVCVHPTFLYESLWNLVGFIIINIFYKKKKFNGQIACMYLAWYGFGRFFIEALRTDSLYIPGTEIRISRLVGMLCFIVFGGLLIAGLVYSKKFNDPNAKLTKFDEIIKPSLDAHPVFFAKKKEAVVAEVVSEISENESKEKDSETQGDNKDGTDN